MPTTAAKRDRPTCWKSVGDADTATMLAPHLALTMSVVWTNGLYKSTDMRKSFDVEYLELTSKTLHALMVLDPRGGYFAQDDVRRAVVMNCSDPKVERGMQKLARDIVKPYDVAIGLTAYAYRVMLSHVREKFS
eukprot:5868765-Pyramimonas_sp.AAC.1